MEQGKPQGGDSNPVIAHLRREVGVLRAEIEKAARKAVEAQQNLRQWEDKVLELKGAHNKYLTDIHRLEAAEKEQTDDTTD